ncbi:MAG: DUF721 domain-containing protein [Caulobacteraceae bacterium]
MEPGSHLPSRQETLRILASKPTRPPRRPPPSAGRALASTLKALSKRFGSGGEGLRARWREIVGETLARRTEPIRIVKSRGPAPAILEIRVEGPSATLIAHQADDVLARVNLFLGEGAVGRLRILQGPVRRALIAPSARPARRSVAPLGAAAEGDLSSSLAALSDGRLRRALTILGRIALSGPQPR